MIEWIVSSSVLIVLIAAIRFLFRNRLALRVRYALWLLVAVRLLVPVSFWASSFSILNLLAADAESEEALRREETDREGKSAEPGETGQSGHSGEWRDVNVSAGSGFAVAGIAGNGSGIGGSGNAGDIAGDREYENSGNAMGNQGDGSPAGNQGGGSDGSPAGNQGDDSLARSQSNGSTGTAGSQGEGGVSVITGIGSRGSGLFLGIWLSGVVLCTVTVAAGNSSYRRRLRRSRKPCRLHMEDGLPVYMSPVVSIPCLFGLVHPAIYLNPGAVGKREALGYVLSHENTHYKHRDNLWALVRTVCVCVHWYNPLVWLAARASRQDCELACDEEVLGKLGERERVAYGRALLDFSVQENGMLGSLQAAITISGGKKQLKERLMIIVQKPKRNKGAFVCTLILALLVSTVTFTGKVDAQASDGKPGSGGIFGEAVAGVGTGSVGIFSEVVAGDEMGSSGASGKALDGERESGAAWGLHGDRDIGETGGKEDASLRNDGQIEHYVRDLSIDLRDGKDYVLHVSGGTISGTGEYQTGQIDLCLAYDGGEEVLQTIRAGDVKVFYTKPMSAAEPFPDSDIGVQWCFSSEGEEVLFAKPLRSLEDLPGWASQAFLEGDGGELWAYAPDGGIIVADLNFDGYDDICLQAGVGSANTPYYCWLWDPGAGRFEHSYMIPNVKVDGEAQLLESITKDGDGVYSIKYYRFDEGNSLHLVRYVEENQSPDASFPFLDLTYCEDGYYTLPAVDDWDCGAEYGGALTERLIYWAKQALVELYEWSGTKIDTACFSATDFGSFYFGNSPADVRASRIFYDRTFGARAGFRYCIESMRVSTERLFWYSNVIQWNVPDNLRDMTNAQAAEWYFGHCALAKGEKVADVEEVYADTFVIKAESGHYYEMSMYPSTREVSSVYGPYDNYPTH